MGHYRTLLECIWMSNPMIPSLIIDIAYTSLIIASPPLSMEQRLSNHVRKGKGKVHWKFTYHIVMWSGSQFYATCHMGPQTHQACFQMWAYKYTQGTHQVSRRAPRRNLEIVRTARPRRMPPDAPEHTALSATQWSNCATWQKRYATRHNYISVTPRDTSCAMWYKLCYMT